MALRLVDIYRPNGAEDLEMPENGYAVLDHWSQPLSDGGRVDRVLLEVDETEGFMDWIDQSVWSEYRIVLQSVEATFPRPEPEEEEEAEEETPPDDANEESTTTPGRTNREELYEYARDAADVSPIFYALVVLSTIVAAGGMLRNQAAVVIGAMVIAPLIGPNLALALGTTLGDTRILSKAARANITGLVVAFVGAVGLGVGLMPWHTVDPLVPELAARTEVGLADLALAAASGAAGALSITREGATALVGVMMAVALLPPVVATGVLLGAGFPIEAIGAGLLTGVNIVAVNLAAVCTFLVQGVRPARWHEVEQAKTSTRIAVSLWLAALILLGVLVYLAQ
mgnify:CR=1 FL=1